METTDVKNHRVSFVDGQKETFLQRLREVIRGRPMQQVADEWGVPKSTLNNYFYRGSSPRIAVLMKIAQKENIEYEWLAGIRNEPSTEEYLPQPQPQPQPQPLQKVLNGDEGAQLLLTLWNGLEPSEKERLYKILIRKGADFLTLLLDRDIEDLHELCGVRRAAALSLKTWPEERIRESFEGFEAEGGHYNLTDKRDRA